MRRKPDFRQLFADFLIVLAIILLFTFFDYFAHSLKAEYGVPSYYFRNKALYGTLIGFIAYLLVRNKSLITQALFFSSAVSILLQVRYLLEGYPRDFVLLFLLIHFIVLVPVSLIIFTLRERILL